MMMMMMMMTMNYFYGMVDRRKAFSLISSRDRCQRSSPSRISDTPQAGFEPVQNISSGLVEWSCVVVVTTTQRRHTTYGGCNFEISQNKFFTKPKISKQNLCFQKKLKESLLGLQHSLFFLWFESPYFLYHSVNKSMLKVNNRNTRTMC